jgi:hypothetical protein
MKENNIYIKEEEFDIYLSNIRFNKLEFLIERKYQSKLENIINEPDLTILFRDKKLYYIAVFKKEDCQIFESVSRFEDLIEFKILKIGTLYKKELEYSDVISYIRDVKIKKILT